MNCRDCKMHIVDLARHGDGAPRAEETRAHIANCANCRSEFEKTNRLAELVNDYPDALADEHLSHRLLVDYTMSPEELAPSDMEMVESHLNHCAECREVHETVVYLAGIELDTPDQVPARAMATVRDRLSDFFSRPERSLGVGVATAVLAVFLAYFSWQFMVGPPDGDRSVSETSPSALAIVGFRDAEQSDVAFTAGMPQLLELGLGETSTCRVVDLHRVDDTSRRLFGATPDEIDHMQAVLVARATGASTMLSGEKRRAGGETYVDVRVTDTSTGEVIGERTATLESVLGAANDLAADILSMLAPQCVAATTDATRSIQDMATASPEAFAHYIRGKTARIQALHDAAVDELSRAVQIDSSFALAYYELAKCFYGEDVAEYDPDRARSYIGHALRFDDRLSERDRLRLDILRMKVEGNVGDNIERTMEVCHVLLQRWPDDLEVIKEYAQALFWFWEFGAAGEVAARALESFPENIQLRETLARSLAWTGHPDEALEQYRILAHQTPDVANAWNNLAFQHLRMGRPDSAEVYMRRAFEIDPTFGDSLLTWGYLTRSRGQIGRTMELLDEIGNDTSRPVMTRMVAKFQRAMVRMRQGQFERAIEIYEETAKMSPSRAVMGFVGVQRALTESGRPEQALANIRAHYPAELPDGPVGQELMIALVAADSLETVEPILDRHIREEIRNGPHKHASLFLKAEIETRRGNPSEAIRLLGRLKAMGVPTPGDGEARYRAALARAYRAAGRYGEAVRVLTSLLRVDPLFTRAHLELARTYDDMGRLDDAQREYEKFLAAWSSADEGLAEVNEAMRWLERRNNSF